MMSRFKEFAKKSKTAIIAYNIYANWQVRRQLRAGNFETSTGSTHSVLSRSESLDYIRLVFDDYLKYSGLSNADLLGKRILEIGPGDNLGVALMFLASGAAHVVALDKFYSKRDEARQREIYRALRGQLDADSRRRFDAAINLDGQLRANPDMLRYVYGHGMEEAGDALGAESFDVIVSRAVLEEIYDIDAAFAGMDKALAPGGLAVHKIDFRDYGMFTACGMHPLTFLTVPDSLYKRMTADCGKPNRRLIDYYQRKMAELGYDARMFVTHVVGRPGELIPHRERLDAGRDYSEAAVALVREIRPRLRPQFRRLSDEQLMVAGIFLVARKPSGRRS